MRKRIILMSGTGAGVLFWFLDAFANSVLFKNGTLLSQLFKSGEETYQEIQHISPSAKAFFTSGYTADSIHGRGMLGGEENITSKPVAPTELLRKVREVLDRPAG